MAVALAVVAAVVSVLMAAALCGYLARRRILGWFRRELLLLAGPAVVRALPPRVALSSLLERIYGDDSGNEDVLVGVLGGAGRRLDGRDVAASRSTTAHFRLRSIDRSTCSVVYTVTHRLAGAIVDHSFVVFATCDAQIWDITSRERLVPLYESWYVPDPELFEEIIPDLQESLEVGIGYEDDRGGSHDVKPCRIRSSEVALRDYGKYVQLPGTVDRKNLRILRFDLADLVEDDHVLGAVQSLSVRFEAKEPLDDGFLTWSPPYPCSVEKLSFDLTEFSDDLVFKIVVFTMKATSPGAEWVHADDVREVPIGCWLLPGHGVALLWKPANEVGSTNAPR